MMKFYKPARDSRTHQRGFFSYISESVVHIHNVLLQHPSEELKIYHDLCDIFGYGSKNIYNICFVQDEEDYITNTKDYSNIESFNYVTTLNAYESESLNKENLILSESIIKKYFVLNDEMKNMFSSRHSEINFDKTIGFHRRSTDMATIHHVETIHLNHIFNTLEKEEFENIFLMSDNLDDILEFKKRYGNRLITYDEFTSSSSTETPFFKLNNEESLIEQHVKELVFGAYTLGMTKKFFCTKSNLSAFSIFSNSNLNFIRLN